MCSSSLWWIKIAKWRYYKLKQFSKNPCSQVDPGHLFILNFKSAMNGSVCGICSSDKRESHLLCGEVNRPSDQCGFGCVL